MRNMKAKTGYWKVYRPLEKVTYEVTPKELPKHIKFLVENGDLDGDLAEWIDSHEEEIWDFWYDFVNAKGDMRSYYRDCLDYYVEELIRETFKVGEDTMLCGCKYEWVEP